MRVLLVGAGGYGSGYVKTLLKPQIPDIKFEGIVDPFISDCPLREEIIRAKVPVYNTLEEFYKNHIADLAVICTPTFLHCEQCIFAVAHGSHVLCEKPVSPTTEEAFRMLEAEEKFGRFIAIGYQWSYSDAVHLLKKDVLNGVLGQAVSFKTIISWPRNRSYYNRGDGWAGKIRHNGKLLLDSVASNACAHYLHNMFFVLGDKMNTSITLKDFSAECYRANDIENFDTCCIQMKTTKGTNLFFAATHAANKKRNPEFIYTFENATVAFSQNKDSFIKARFKDGTEKNYGNPFSDDFKKLRDCVLAAKNGTRPVCTVETAITHTTLIENIFKSISVNNFNKKYIYDDTEANAVYVDGLYEQLCVAYEKEIFFSKTDNEIFNNKC